MTCEIKKCRKVIKKSRKITNQYKENENFYVKLFQKILEYSTKFRKLFKHLEIDNSNLYQFPRVKTTSLPRNHMEQSLPQAPRETLYYINGRFEKRFDPPPEPTIEELKDQIIRMRDYHDVMMTQKNQEIKALKDQVKCLQEINIRNAHLLYSYYRQNASNDN